jgi:hypothetical protein
MKLARLFLAVLSISTLAACADSVTAPQAAPESAPSMDGVSCTGGVVTRTVNQDGTVTERCTGTVGSGG